ncbi:MAG TPA: protein kinase [Pyrinomonadaceae bacterium]|jgi:serine/threonine protein kinase
MKFCPKCGGTFDGNAGFCPDDGTVLEAAPPVQVGQVLDGQYEIEAFIARGGMGTLHRARHILLGDRVVIKTLRPEMRSNSEWLRRFQREGQAARRFRHPNAVTVYDLRANADGLTYMVMEFVEGHTLDQELKKRGRFTPAEALEVLEPVARALDMAHDNGVIHRDLKPENVMLSQDGQGRLQIKLLDLGIAKMRGVADAVSGEDGGLTVAGQILGTPYYMSPEQWGAHPRDGNKEVDGRTDIYSLGVIFYELCAGHKPFIASSLPEMQQAHLTQEPTPLNEVAPDVPEAFAQAVARAMAKDRNDRQRTVAELADELRTALDMSVVPRTAQTLADGLTVPGVGARQPRQTHAGEAHTVSQTGTPTHGGSQMPARTSSGASAPLPPPPVAPAPAPVAAPAPAGPNGAAVAPAPVVTPAPGGRRSAMPLVAGVAALLLLVAGVGGWFAWQRMKPQPNVNQPVVGTNKNGNANTPPPAAPVEALSFWIEAFDSAKQQTGARVANAGAISLRSGQQFRFHFSPRERGYLYIIGPGAEGNALQTFLTARPVVGGMKTNLAPAGSDFSFPYGAGQVFQLDTNPGAEEYTVIFSPTPLLKPEFFTTQALHTLTPDEVAALEQFRAQAQTGTVAARVEAAGDAPPAVAVNVPGADAGGKPVVFDIRIEHK